MYISAAGHELHKDTPASEGHIRGLLLSRVLHTITEEWLTEDSVPMAFEGGGQSYCLHH